MSAYDHVPVAPDQCAMSSVSEKYWHGLAEGRLSIPYCERCEKPFFFPRKWCPRCWSPTSSWIDASGRGRLYTRCSVDMPFDGWSPEDIPYTVALIDLDEGVRLPGRLKQADSDMPIGGRVVIEFAKDPSTSLPVWRKAEGSYGIAARPGSR